MLPLQARLVRQEAANGHVLDRAEGVGDRGELRKVNDQGIVEAQTSLVAQLQYADRREDLGVGGDAVQRVGVRPTRLDEVGEAGGSGPCEAGAGDDAHGGARQVFLVHERAGVVEQLLGDRRDALVHVDPLRACQTRPDCPSCPAVGQGWSQ